jgi:hypothetical protein
MKCVIKMARSEISPTFLLACYYFLFVAVSLSFCLGELMVIMICGRNNSTRLYYNTFVSEIELQAFYFEQNESEKRKWVHIRRTNTKRLYLFRLIDNKHCI